MNLSDRVRKTVAGILEPEEASELSSFISLAAESDRERILEFLEKHPAWARKFLDNIRMKKNALENDDKKMWDAILTEEKRELSGQ